MRVAVIGSGPSGIHFAATALEMGYEVVLLDGGQTVVPPPYGAENFLKLKSVHPQSVEYFLGDDYSAIEVELGSSGVYGFPGSKLRAFVEPVTLGVQANGFQPLMSHAVGGLAECWTGGAYPFTDGDLAQFPFAASKIMPHYGTVAARIGIGGVEDDMAEAFPAHESLLPPVPMNQSSAKLLERYEARRSRIQQIDPGAIFGRSRQAALSSPLNGRASCVQCGRCLWGCPNGAFYTPSLTLAELRSNPKLIYRPGALVSHLSFTNGEEVEAAVLSGANGQERVSADLFVLAAGTIPTAGIFLRSYWARDRDAPVLRGLMDNRQVLLPVINLAMIGRPYSPESYQYHQLALGLNTERAFDYVHGQVTMLTTATAHPVIKQLPFGLAPARAIFAELRSALGIVNLNFSDTRRPENRLFLDPENKSEDGWPILRIKYDPPAGEKGTISDAIRRTRRLMRELRAPCIPGMAQVRPMGSSVHYAGTLPMQTDRAAHSVFPDGRSQDFSNLVIADGSVFPALPAKNLTFTLMANATRIARETL